MHTSDISPRPVYVVLGLFPFNGSPLGLALYWLVNNVLMILERLVLSKMIKEEE